MIAEPDAPAGCRPPASLTSGWTERPVAVTIVGAVFENPTNSELTHSTGFRTRTGQCHAQVKGDR
jgi:hypothetical protein